MASKKPTEKAPKPKVLSVREKFESLDKEIMEQLEYSSPQEVYLDMMEKGLENEARLSTNPAQKALYQFAADFMDIIIDDLDTIEALKEVGYFDKKRPSQKAPASPLPKSVISIK